MYLCALLQLDLWGDCEEQFVPHVGDFVNPFRKARVCVCVYDVTKFDTLHSLPVWLEDAKRYASENVAVILCGNKIDLLEEDSDDRHEDVTKSAEALKQNFPDFSSHILISCKLNGRLEALKEEIGKQLLAQMPERPRVTSTLEKGSRMKCCCCQ